MAPLPPISPATFVAHCQAEGFTPPEAASWYAERVALGSPCQFEPQRLRRTPWLRALAQWHRRLRAALDRVRTVEDWVDYCHAWSHASFQGPCVDDTGRYIAHGEARAFLRTHWPLLTFGEPSGAFDRRCEGPWLEPDPTLRDWTALEDRIRHPRFLRRLLAAVADPLPPAASDRVVRAEWAQVLRQTGLRSMRWHWAEDLNASEMRGLGQMLVEVQTLLNRPLGWGGPVLGLAGATGLELRAGEAASGSGHVRLDPLPTGQTLMVDDFGVLAHEWLHTLDATLARDTHQPVRYQTQALLSEEPTLPQTVVLAQAGAAWWTMVEQVLMTPLPDAVRSAVQADLARWPERVRASLGATAPLERLLEATAMAMDHHRWEAATAQQTWAEWVEAHLAAPPDLAERTAAWVVRDLALGADPTQVPEDQPTWAWFLHEAGMADSAGHGPGRGRYLAQPIELMARSFEAAYGPREGWPDPVWRVTRSAVGMIWPLPAERAYQRKGWEACLAALKPWWALRCATAGPLGVIAARQKRLRWRTKSENLRTINPYTERLSGPYQIKPA